MTKLTYAVALRQVDELEIEAVNRAGRRIRIAPPGAHGTFTPIELLLAALGGCAAIDVARVLAGAGSPYDGLELDVRGQRPLDQPRLDAAALRYRVATRDAAAVERAVALTGSELCTVALTMRDGCDVTHEVGVAADGGTTRRSDD